MSAAHLLLIGIDGLRIDRAFGTGLAPELDRLASLGAMRQSAVEVPTISGPGWSSILTGATHAEHGVVDNTFRDHRIAPESDLLSRAWHEDPECTTMAVVGWRALADPAGPGPVIATRREQLGTGQHHVVCLDGEVYGYRLVDEEVSRRARVGIDYAGPDVGFVYFAQPDDAGHYWGVHTEEYDDAVRMTDARVGRLVRAVERRVDERGERWLIAVTTDHGHVDEGGHGGGSDAERQTFLLVATFGDLPKPVMPTLLPHEFAGYLLGLRRNV